MIILISTKATICEWSWTTRGIEWQIAMWCSQTHKHSRGQKFSFICWICPLWVGVPYVHRVVQRCLQISVSWWEIFQKSRNSGVNSLSNKRKAKLYSNKYTLPFTEGKHWLVSEGHVHQMFNVFCPYTEFTKYTSVKCEVGLCITCCKNYHINLCCELFSSRKECLQ